MENSPDQAREGEEELDGIENSLKVYIGRVKALDDPAFRASSPPPRPQLKAKSAGNAAIGDPWGDIASAMAAYRGFYVAYRLPQPQGDLFGYALTLVRAADRARQAQRRAPARLYRQRLAVARKAPARREADLPVARPADDGMVAVQGARISRRRRSRRRSCCSARNRPRPSPRGWSRARGSPTRPCARRCGTAARRRSTPRTIR